MGIWTHDKFWRGHYSLELANLCVSAAFSMSNVQTLIAAASPENRGSCALMKAMGMSPVDLVMRDTEMGYPVLLHEYSIARSDWKLHHATAFELFRPDDKLPLAPSMQSGARKEELLGNEERA